MPPAFSVVVAVEDEGPSEGKDFRITRPLAAADAMSVSQEWVSSMKGMKNMQALLAMRRLQGGG